MEYKITNSKAYLLGIELEEPFKLGFGVLKSLPRVFYQLAASNGKEIKEGWGEASIDFPFCNYDAWDIYNILEKSEQKLIGINLGERENLLKSQELRNTIGMFPAAFCAFNMAIDDLYGKCNNKTIFELYGKQRTGGSALKSIGYKDEPGELIQSINAIVKDGFTPKPKVGMGIEKDIETIIIVDKWAQKNNMQYSLDFNAAYTKEQFIKIIDEVQKKTDLISCLAIEQPTTKEEGIETIAKVKEYAKEKGLKTNFMADESFVTKEDAALCVKNGIMLNYKLQKIGGMYIAKEIEKETGAEIVGGMVGGTFPTALGRAYDQQAACILKGISIPSDGLLPSTDYFSGNKHIINENFIVRQGTDKKIIVPFESKGIGVTVNLSKLANFVVENPAEEYSLIRNNHSGKKIQIEMKGNETYKEKYEKTSGRSCNWNLG